MKKEGFVSLWVSAEADPDTVEAAFDENYTEEGDWIPPPFARAFGFETFDPATREAQMIEAPADSIRGAVAGFSYDSQIAERFVQAYGDALPIRATAVALLYNFQFSGEPSSAVVGGSKWFYVGCVPYHHGRQQ